jgi:aspartate racemase
MSLKPAIGVIGGLGPQASALLYKLIIYRARLHTDLRDTADYPRVVLLSTSIPNYLASGEAQDPKIMAKVIGLVAEEVMLLEQSGAIVNCIACNTAHLALEQLQSVTSVPFLSIMELMKNALSNFKRPGLLCTCLTKQTHLYDNVHPNIFIPNDDVLQQAEVWIFKLLDGSLSDVDARDLRTFVSEYKSANNLDAVALACTELPVIYGEHDDSTVISTLDVLADGVLAYYYKHIDAC